MKPADAEVQEQVDRLFDRFERMTDAEFIMLRAVWAEQDPAARQEAWSMVKAALRTQHRAAMLDDARNRIAAWVNNHPPAISQGDVPVGFSRSGMDANTVREEAIPPMLDAIAATIAADGLDQDQRWALLKPVASVSQ